MKPTLLIGLVAALGLAGSAAWLVGVKPAQMGALVGLGTAPAPFQPRTDDQIPKGPYGDLIRLGEQIFREPGTYAAAYVGNDLRCSNCHLNAGRLAGAAPMWAAYTAYPAYRSKTKKVDTFAERLQGCFDYSMNGTAPPLGDKVLVALETYSYFLAKSLPTGETIPGHGFPALPKPDLPGDYARGGQVYAQNCASCHGAQGQGQSSGGKVVFPPLWGARSYNWGAGMTSIESAASFIRANMPLGLGGSLSVQQAWDVATYMDSQVRPQDPRFDGDVQSTRAKYANTPMSMYGRTVNGVVLGDPATTPPARQNPPAVVTN